MVENRTVLAGWPQAVPIVPVAVMLGVGLWGLGRPSYWRDESVSVEAGRKPLPELWNSLRGTDAVHGLYYLLLHPVTAMGTSETVTRLPSVLAAAAAAGGIAVLARRFHSPAAGLLAGVIFAVLPLVSRYAQETRQYTMVSAAVVLATYLLVRALEQPRPHLRWYGWYAVTLAGLGWLHLFSLFMLSAHVVTVAVLVRHRGAAWRPHLLAWGGAVAVALAAVLPLVLVARRQQAQVAWLTPPSPHAVVDFGLLIAGGTTMLLALLVLAVVGVAALLGGGSAEGAAVVVPWLVLPLASNMIISQVHPVYHPRYVLYTVCALAIAAGVGAAAVAARLPGPARLAVLAAIPVSLGWLGLPAQVANREPGSRPDNLRALAAVLRAGARPGDAVLFVPLYRKDFVTVYGDAFARLNATALAAGADDLPAGRFRSAIGAQRRIWVVEVPPPRRRYRSPIPLRNLAALRADHDFARTGRWKFGTVHLDLFVRTCVPGSGPTAAGRSVPGPTGGDPRARPCRDAGTGTPERS
jgi:mannosyltransferase